jgi:hypothetical protein
LLSAIRISWATENTGSGRVRCTLFAFVASIAVVVWRP